MKILSNKKYNELILKSCKGMFGAVNDDMLLRENALLNEENKQLKEDKKKAREFIYRYWITYDESKNFTEFNEEMNILIKDIKKLLEILGDKENE